MWTFKNCEEEGEFWGYHKKYIILKKNTPVFIEDASKNISRDLYKYRSDKFPPISFLKPNKNIG